LPSPLLTLEKVVVGYDHRPVLGNLSLRLDADDRIGLLGANGNGKSTLIKLLAGRLTPLARQMMRSRKLRFGYFAQHQTDELDVNATPALALLRKRPRDAEVAIRKFLGRFGFSQQRADTRIGDLSGGEKARLLFALMSSERPHILLLDEPTNHLDMMAREALIQAVNAFAGAVIIVSHDPHILELTVDRFWLVRDGRVETFEGDLDDYRSLLQGRGADADGPVRTDGAEASRSRRKEQRRLAGEKRQTLAPLKKQLARAEDAVHRLEAEKSRLEVVLADPGLYQGDPARLVEFKKQLGQVEKDLAAAETAWMALQQSWDEAQADAC
jgi:ATP-binding cassette subfamily F protein 3